MLLFASCSSHHFVIQIIVLSSLLAFGLNSRLWSNFPLQRVETLLLPRNRIPYSSRDLLLILELSLQSRSLNLSLFVFPLHLFMFASQRLNLIIVSPSRLFPYSLCWMSEDMFRSSVRPDVRMILLATFRIMFLATFQIMAFRTLR